MIFTNLKVPRSLSDIKIAENIIMRKSRESFLGIVLDEELKFNYHISNIANKVSKSVGIIYRLSSFLPKSCLLNLYYSFVYPYLTYCNLVWGGTFKCHLQSLVVLQKRALRTIFGVTYYAHTNPLFFESRVLKLEDVHKYSVACYVYKEKLYVNPNFMIQHSYNTRNSVSLNPRFKRLALTQNSIEYVGPTIWNILPEVVKSSSSIFVFKKRLKDFLISLYV